MFGTLKAGKKSNAGSMVFVEDNRPNRGISGSPHIACRGCREKKLKCTGEPAGCKRCKSINVCCEYPSPTEDRRGGRSRRTTQTSAVSLEAPASSKAQVNHPELGYQHPSVRPSNPNFENMNGDDLDLDFPIPPFPDTALDENLGGDFTMMNDESLLEHITGGSRGSPSDEDLGIFSGNYDVDVLPELDPALDTARHGDTSSDSDRTFSADTSVSTRPESMFLDNIIPPTPRWQKNGTSVEFDPRSASRSSQTSARTRPHRMNSLTPSLPSARDHTKRRSAGTPAPVRAAQPMLKRPSPESVSSDSESDSLTAPCRCIERALRLLEKLPSLNNPSSQRAGGDQSPEWPYPTLESGGAPSPRLRSNTFGNTFISAGAPFLSHFSRYMTIFSAVSSCQACLRKSSFVMILLMLAQRLTSHVKVLLRQHSPVRNGSAGDGVGSNGGKFTLTIGEHPVEYEDLQPLLSTLLAGKICRLAACIARVKGVCVGARWNAYARGFEALEGPLKERMGELEIMM